MWLEGQVDQLEDRYLGMVEASGSNPDLSISLFLGAISSAKPKGLRAEESGQKHFKPRINKASIMERGMNMIKGEARAICRR